MASLHDTGRFGTTSLARIHTSRIQIGSTQRIACFYSEQSLLHSLHSFHVSNADMTFCLGNYNHKRKIR